MTPNELVRKLRTGKGLSQRRLALRAGTSQSAIDRIERGQQELTWKRLRSILLAMGEQPVVVSRPLEGRYDPDDVLRDRGIDVDRRLEAGANAGRFAAEVRSNPARKRRAGRS